MLGALRVQVWVCGVERGPVHVAQRNAVACAPCLVVWVSCPYPCSSWCPVLKLALRPMCAAAVVNTHTHAGDRHDAVYVNTTDADIMFCPGSRTHFEFFQREVCMCVCV